MSDQYPPPQNPYEPNAGGLPQGNVPPPGWGQPPTGPPGSHPYGGPGQYGGAYIPPLPQKKGNGVWIVLGIIALVLLVTCGGCLALVGLAVNETQDVIAEATEEYAGPGGPGRPTEVVQGEAFTIDEWEFGSGWKVRRRDGEVRGLSVTNQGDSTIGDSTSIGLTYLDGSGVELGEWTCSTSGLVETGETVDLSCFGFLPDGARRLARIEVEQSY